MKSLIPFNILENCSASATNPLGAQTGILTAESVISSFVAGNDYKLETEGEHLVLLNVPKTTSRIALLKLGETVGKRTQVIALIASKVHP